MVRKIQNLKYWKRGSYTVETAAVMSLVLFVILSSLYLCFYVHNRVWLTSAAYEAALAGSMEGIKQKGNVYETALIRGKELGNTGFFGAENLEMQVEAGKTVSVNYNLDTISAFGNLQWTLSAEGKSKIIDPVQRIRQLKAAAEIIEGLGGQ